MAYNVGNIEGQIILKDNTQAALGSVTRGIQSGFKKIVSAIKILTVATMAGFAGAIKVAADFEEQMIEVSKVVAGFDEHRDSIESFAKVMSTRWAVSTRDVGNAMAFMGSMGQDALEIQENLNNVMQMGIALNISMEQAARMVTNAQAVFAKESLTVVEIADKLNSVTNQTAANVDFLAGALRYAGPAAAATGASMDQLLGVLTPLAEAGFQGTMAGRALNTIFPKMTQSAAMLADEMKWLADEGFDVNTKAMEGFMDANPAEQIVMLSEATQGLDDDMKRQLATFLGGTQFFKQMFILLENGEGIMEGMGYAVDSVGSAQEEAEKTTQSLNFRLRQMKQQVLFIGMDIGERLLPQMHGFLDVAEGWLPTIEDVGVALAGFAIEVTTLLGSLVSGDWGAAQTSFDNLQTMFDTTATNLLASFENIDWSGTFDGILTVAETIWGSILAVAVPTGDQLIAWLNDVVWEDAWESFKTFSGTIWESVLAIAIPTIEQLQQWLVGINWWHVWDGFKTFGSGIWEELLAAAVPTVAELTAWLDDVVWEDVFTGFGTWLADIGLWGAEEIGNLDAALDQMVDNTDWASFLSKITFAIANAPFDVGVGIGERIAEVFTGGSAGEGTGGGGGGVKGGKGFNFWDWLTNLVPGGQHGLDMNVNKPTLFMAGEGYQRESVSVTPGGGGGRAVRVQQIIINEASLGSSYGRGQSARDLASKLGKELMLNR